MDKGCFLLMRFFFFLFFNFFFYFYFLFFIFFFIHRFFFIFCFFEFSSNFSFLSLGLFPSHFYRNGGINDSYHCYHLFTQQKRGKTLFFFFSFSIFYYSIPLHFFPNTPPEPPPSPHRQPAWLSCFSSFSLRFS